MTPPPRAVLARSSTALLLIVSGLACTSTQTAESDRSLTTPPPTTQQDREALSADWESTTRDTVEALVEESRWLAAQGATSEALERVDEALCEALVPPPGVTVSSSYLDWVSELIAEAQALEQDLDLLPGAQDGELVDLPPLEIASDLEDVDAVDADIEKAALPRFDVPVEFNSTVLRFLDAMSGDTEYRRRIEVGMGRAGRYLPMIRSKLVDAGLPTDLAYLPLIESAFSPSAYSRARAVGMWQFISATGRHYGLSVGSLVDERRDPELSTDAAIAYLTDLYGEFGDWSLALAAYNSGAGNVRRAIRRSGSRDFWALRRYLPRETRNYVPAYMASVIVAKDPAKYGFEAPIESDWVFDQITVSDALDLEFLAGTIDLDLDTLRDLNPAIRRDLTPASGRTTIRLPLGFGTTAESILDATPKSEWAPRMMHTVRRGESLYSIAMRYGSNVSAIRQANGIRGNLIHPGQTLVVPRFGYRRPQPTRRLASGGTYVVQRHDTLWDISRAFGTSVGALCAANGLTRRSTIRPGQRLVIPDGARAAAPASKASTYTVRRGDTLSAIARRHGVSVSELRRANGLSGSRIYPGDELRIPSSRARG